MALEIDLLDRPVAGQRDRGRERARLKESNDHHENDHDVEPGRHWNPPRWARLKVGAASGGPQGGGASGRIARLLQIYPKRMRKGKQNCNFVPMRPLITLAT